MQRAAIFIFIGLLIGLGSQTWETAVAAPTADSGAYLPFIRAGKSPADSWPYGQSFNGEATYYTFADGSGNCGFPATPDDLMVGALNNSQYLNPTLDGQSFPQATLCGAYARITGPKGSVTVRLVDRCPECAHGDIDLSPQAFAEIADIPQGRVPISWELVSPPVSGNIVIHFKDGSNPWWTAVQIRNHRNPVAIVEVLGGSGNTLSLSRESYNYFIASGGLGNGPYTVRVTDIFGNAVTTSGVPLLNNASTPGAGQFPPP